MTDAGADHYKCENPGHRVGSGTIFLASQLASWKAKSVSYVNLRDFTEALDSAPIGQSVVSYVS